MIDLVEKYNQIVAEDPSRAGALGTDDVADISAREARDKRLAESDWRVLPDSASPMQAEWRTYRQALRDLPAQSGWPLNVVWPTEPGV